MKPTHRLVMIHLGSNSCAVFTSMGIYIPGSIEKQGIGKRDLLIFIELLLFNGSCTQFYIFNTNKKMKR